MFDGKSYDKSTFTTRMSRILYLFESGENLWKISRDVLKETEPVD